jgi:hypothetical protein
MTVDKKTRKRIKKILGIIENKDISFRYDPFTKTMEVYVTEGHWGLCLRGTVEDVLAGR